MLHLNVQREISFCGDGSPKMFISQTHLLEKTENQDKTDSKSVAVNREI